MIKYWDQGWLVEHLDDGRVMLVGKVCDPTYVPEEGDLYMPNVGGGILVPEDMRLAIIQGRLTFPSLVPYFMLLEKIEVASSAVQSGDM